MTEKYPTAEELPSEDASYVIKDGTALELAHFQRMEQMEASFYSSEFITPAFEAFRWSQEHPRTTVAAFRTGGLVGFVNMLPVQAELFERILAGTFNDAELTADDIPAFGSLKPAKQAGGQDGVMGNQDIADKPLPEPRFELRPEYQPEPRFEHQPEPRRESRCESRPGHQPEPTCESREPSEPAENAPFELFLSCIAVDSAHRGGGLSRMLLSEALALYTPPANDATRIITDNVTDAGARFSERLGFDFVAESDHGSRIYVTTLGKLKERLNAQKEAPCIAEPNTIRP